MTSNDSTSDLAWPLRVWVLALIGGLFALGIEQLGNLPQSGWIWGPRLVTATMLFLATGGIAFGLAWVRGRLIGAMAIALLCALVAGSVLLVHGSPQGTPEGSDGWHLVSGLAAAVLLLTLFQAAQDGSAGWPARWWTPAGLRSWRRTAIGYAGVHGHLWTNALLGGLAILFAGLSFAIAHLLAEMFRLVKIDLLRDLLRDDWFAALLIGTAFGGAVGLLRDRGPILTALQRVAMIVLRVLAPVLAAGIFVFLAALIFTGLDPLWSTGDTTPIMLAGAMLALFLANAVVSDNAQDESRSRIMGAAAAALGLFLLPMVGIAAYSSGLRIQQHGLSPDRLWALAFLIIASIVAVAYAVAILGARGWFARLRQTNLRLAFLLAGIALLLSTPLLGFERLATAHQLARLAGGQVSPEHFDYRALWFDFGPPGRAAIARLAARSSDATIRRHARAVQTLPDRWFEPPNAGPSATGVALDARLTILPQPLTLDDALRARLVRPDACGSGRSPCTLRYRPGDDHAIVISGPDPSCRGCTPGVTVLLRAGGQWSDEGIYLAAGGDTDLPAAVRAGTIELRPVERRQFFVDGKPVGEVLPAPDAAVP
jgi:hypothetical protein